MTKNIKNKPVTLSYSLLFVLLSFSYSFLPTFWFFFPNTKVLPEVIISLIVIFFYNLPLTFTVIMPILTIFILLNLFFILQEIVNKKFTITKHLVVLLILIVAYALIGRISVVQTTKYQIDAHNMDPEYGIGQAFLLLMIIPWPIILGFNLYSLIKKQEHWIALASLLILIAFFGAAFT